MQLKIGLLWYILKKVEKSNRFLFWGYSLFSIGLTTAGYGLYLTSYVYKPYENPSTIPFYVGISALLLVLLGTVLVMQGKINRMKQTPS